MRSLADALASEARSPPLAPASRPHSPWGPSHEPPLKRATKAPAAEAVGFPSPRPSPAKAASPPSSSAVGAKPFDPERANARLSNVVNNLNSLQGAIAETRKDANMTHAPSGGTSKELGPPQQPQPPKQDETKAPGSSGTVTSSKRDVGSAHHPKESHVSPAGFYETVDHQYHHFLGDDMGFRVYDNVTR